MIKFGFYTDAHLTGKSFSSRLDNYPQVILGKIAELYEYGKTQNFDFMLYGGDMFHTHRIYSYDVIGKLIKIIKGFGKPTYFITGQHDLYGGNIDFFGATTLSFVSEMCEGMFVPIFKQVELKHCILYGCHTFLDPLTYIPAIPKDSKFQICLDHHLLHNETEQFSIIRTSSIGETNANLVLSGDLHCGYPYHLVGETAYYNPGSIARNSIHNINRTVKMGVFEVTPFLGKWDINMHEFVPKQALGKDIFRENTIQEVYDLKVVAGSFIQCFEELKKQAVDIYHLLDIVATKENTISAELMQYIRTFKKEEKK